MNFIEKCLSGDAFMDEIDDYVERWSDGEEGEGMALHDFLGMTWEEYSIWGTRPSMLPVILRSRRNSVSRAYLFVGGEVYRTQTKELAAPRRVE
uniref:Uncharacterized protein n=1 Tax=Candidatus Kentrum sp. FM TaxID=2126340 RepID=A0A450VZV3_9GAMM|nr:MAG: hypothetical protein BECKFM1743A_GA0114220_100321 [Candidatus Kentron sp. FM]VFJ51562.1 MAG: hypothetical protein BECKFM1743C_GA0114222_100982 [Candidatus Kentron sp. FM]VFK10338.1 MAG: hypothetical protein BECKFM1743B_GA0114221_101364 [Candidatus Kentron sp. FM]